MLSVAEAASLLPIADGNARAWLRSQGLVRYLVGKPVVVWLDVMETLNQGDEVTKPSKRSRGCSLKRVSLKPS